MKLLSHLMKLLHLMTLSSQQFCLCDILFNVHDTVIKHALRLALVSQIIASHPSNKVFAKKNPSNKVETSFSLNPLFLSPGIVFSYSEKIFKTLKYILYPPRITSFWYPPLITSFWS